MKKPNNQTKQRRNNKFRKTRKNLKKAGAWWDSKEEKEMRAAEKAVTYKALNEYYSKNNTLPLTWTQQDSNENPVSLPNGRRMVINAEIINRKLAEKGRDYWCRNMGLNYGTITYLICKNGWTDADFNDIIEYVRVTGRIPPTITDSQDRYTFCQYLRARGQSDHGLLLDNWQSNQACENGNCMIRSKC